MQARLHSLAGLLLVFASACTPSGSKAPPDKAAPPAPPEIEVRAERKDLIFSYKKNAGAEFETATRIEDVPAEARAHVVVTDLALSPEVRQAGRYVYVADLTKARKDGTYPVAVASRYGFEAGTSSTAGATGATAGAKRVVMYSASWCGVCKKAKRLMKTWGVPVEEKDIEASRSAQKELAAKAAAHGFQPGGVPVIDVDGIILQGLDPQSLKSALQDKGFL